MRPLTTHLVDHLRGVGMYNIISRYVTKSLTSKSAACQLSVSPESQYGTVLRE